MLLVQRNVGGFVGLLANAPAIDRASQKSLTSTRKWLLANRASGADWEALEDTKTI